MSPFRTGSSVDGPSLFGREPAAIIGAVVAVADALLASPALALPGWLATVLIVVVTIGGALGIRSQVSPS